MGSYRVTELNFGIGGKASLPLCKHACMLRAPGLTTKNKDATRSKGHCHQEQGCY